MSPKKESCSQENVAVERILSWTEFRFQKNLILTNLVQKNIIFTLSRLINLNIQFLGWLETSKFCFQFVDYYELLNLMSFHNQLQQSNFSKYMNCQVSFSNQAKSKKSKRITRKKRERK